MVTNRRPVAASVTAVLFLLVLAAPGASVEYAFYEIRYPDAANGAITAAVDVNNAGTVLGSYFTDEEDFGIPFFWQDGAFSEIEFSEDELAEVLAMNNAGDLAGVSLDDSGAFGFVWDGESLDTFTVTSSPIPGLSLTVPTMMSLGDDLTVIGAYWDLFTEETGVFQWSGEGL
jgi:hypothetical protein